LPIVKPTRSFARLTRYSRHIYFFTATLRRFVRRSWPSSDGNGIITRHGRCA
jgi:hypothetical protein